MLLRVQKLVQKQAKTSDKLNSLVIHGNNRAFTFILFEEDVLSIESHRRMEYCMKLILYLLLQVDVKSTTMGFSIRIELCK
jgi:hypothetical protein